MSKSNFLLVDLNDDKTKKLAETITSETSRKILNHLAEKEDTENNIATMLNLPISTVHYHLQKLQEAGLIIVEEFHYSPKGREVNHYKLANKYIIIAPQKVSGLREKLKGILPVGLVILGIGAVIKLVTLAQRKTLSGANEMLKAAPATLVQDQALEAGMELSTITSAVPAPTPDYALWFLIGAASAMGIYVIILLIKELVRKYKN